MRTIHLFWSNICILHQYEKKALEQLKNILREDNIDLQVTYFGIGCPQSLSDYFKQPDAKLPDLMVSTDLEIFEDQQIYQLFEHELHYLSDKFALKPWIQQTNINQWGTLLPFLAIPLMVITNQKLFDIGWQSIIEEHESIALGGINNSGVRSVIKGLWSEQGIENVEKLVDKGSITNMPIQAYQWFIKQKCQASIVPSIYAQRADEKSSYKLYPKDGAIALPSYIAAFKSVDIDTAVSILNRLLTKDFCNYFVEKGDIICCLANTQAHLLAEVYHQALIYPSTKWFNEISKDEFQAFYTRIMQKQV